MLTFASFRLDLDNEQLWRGQRRVSLRPKTFAVLRYLAERPQQLVTKGELLGALWADVHVGDAVLKTHVKEIRHALSDTAQSSRFIQTVHRRGYRFLASVDGGASSGRAPAALAREQGELLVGRGAERERLQQLLAAALRGRRQVVFVSGEAGIGKTALVTAFLAPLERRDDLWIAWGQCIEQYGAGAPYLPVLEAFGRLARGPHRAAVGDVFRSSAPSWLAQLPELDDVRRGLPHDRALAAVATPERMLREMAETILALAQLRPLVWLLEDLHWADRSTLELISYVARRSDPARLLLIGTYRSDEVRSTQHPLWAIQQGLELHEQCEELGLRRLSPADVGSYLGVRFAGHSFPEVVASVLQLRTAGNPLFMVRVVDTLVKRGVLSGAPEAWLLGADLNAISAAVPASIGTMIECELERLSPFERSILEAASVIGSEFSSELVAAALQADVLQVEQLCAEWARRGRFLCSAQDPLQPTLRCQFIHALYQQVVYQGIGPARQARLHGAIGERLEAAPRCPPALLAMHFERARDPLRALSYRRAAGTSALQQAAYREAIDHFTAALQHAPALAEPERKSAELELQIALGVPLTMTRGYAAPEVEQVYRRAAQLCAELDETARSFPVLSALATFSLMRGRYQEARALGERYLALAGAATDRAAELDANLVLGTACVYLAELPSARDHLEEVLRLYPRERKRARVFVYQQDAYVAAASYLAWVQWLLGDPDRALSLAQESVHFARSLDDPFAVATANFFLGCLHQWRGEPVQALAVAEEVLVSAREQGFQLLLAVAIELKGAVLVESGALQTGIELLRSGWLANLATGSELGRPYWRVVLAEACLSAGLFEECGRVLGEGLMAAGPGGEPTWAPRLYLLHATLQQRAPACAPPLPEPLPPPAGPEQSALRALQLAQHMQIKVLAERAAAVLERLRADNRRAGVETELQSERAAGIPDGLATRSAELA